MNDPLEQQRAYLAQLLEAIQRCAWFLDQSRQKITWPLDGSSLLAHAKDANLFETLAAINERFAKLQDSLAAAMRHTALLMGENTHHFLQVLVLFEKVGVLDSAKRWQQARLVRNQAAHDYDPDYNAIAEHFNTLQQLIPGLFATAGKLLTYTNAELGVAPATRQFQEEFEQLSGP